MERVLTPEFKYVTVWGQANGGREEFLATVPNSHGALPDIEVFVEDIEVREIAQDLFLASFIQVETFADIPPRRYTSAILRMEDGIAKWVLFHLTLIDQSRIPKLPKEIEDNLKNRIPNSSGDSQDE